MPKFQFSGGGGILYYRIGVFCRICTKFSTTPAGSCITDSLSHTTYVETNKMVICSCKGATVVGGAASGGGGGGGCRSCGCKWRQLDHTETTLNMDKQT